MAYHFATPLDGIACEIVQSNGTKATESKALDCVSSRYGSFTAVAATLLALQALIMALLKAHDRGLQHVRIMCHPAMAAQVCCQLIKTASKHHSEIMCSICDHVFGTEAPAL